MITKKVGNLSIFILTIMFLFVASMAEAANWERISEYEDTIIYVDSDSMKHISQTITQAQFKIVFKESTWAGSKSIDYYLIEQENNCSEKKYKVYQVKIYFSDGTNDTSAKKEEHDVNPDTFQSVIHEYMCKKAK